MKKIKNIALSMMAAASMLSAGGDIARAVEEVQVEESQWSYEFQLYALAVWIQGDASLGHKAYDGKILNIPEGSLSGDVDETPKSIVEKLKMGAMAHFEAHHSGGWGLWLDYVFMNLGQSEGYDGYIVNVDADVGIYQGILEAFATYRVPMEKGYIDYFGGIRWWHNDFDMIWSKTVLGKTEISRASRVIDWYDPIIGAVWVTPLNESWKFRLRGDVGGFGIESDFTAAIEIGALYDINKNWQVDMRFKSLWVNYEEGTEGMADYFAYDTVNFGPIVGVTYKF